MSTFRFASLHKTLVGTTLALAVLSGSAGCRRPAAQSIVLTKDQEQQISDNVLSAPPATLQTKVDVGFEDKITLLGYETKGDIKKGSTVDLTLYFRVDQPVTGDWKVFVHFEAPGKRRQPFDHYGIGGLYPVQNWKKGEIVRDTVSIQIPADWPEGETQVLIGFFDWGLWTKSEGTRRLKVTKPGDLKSLPDDRLILATWNLAGGASPGGAAAPKAPVAPAPRPSMQLGKLSSAPTIDGKADDAAWQGVTALQINRQPDGAPLNPALQASVKLAWDADNLYLLGLIKDDEVVNPHKDNDGTLWEGDVLELFLGLPGKDGEYVELQFAPSGARFDAKFTGHRQPKWEDAAKFESGVKHVVVTDGTANGDGADKGFVVEAAIPWKGLGLDGAPALGTKLAANLYRIDNKGTHNLAFMGAWASVGGDFHQLEGAGELIVADTPAAVPAPAVPAVPAVVPAAAPAAK